MLHEEIIHRVSISFIVVQLLLFSFIILSSDKTEVFDFSFPVASPSHYSFVTYVVLGGVFVMWDHYY
jgi:hypothetical protein